MPTIPLLQKPTEIAKPKGLALDNMKRPTVDASSVTAGMGALAKAGQGSEVDPRPFIAAAGAMAPVGEAIMKAGNIVGALAIKRQEAFDEETVQRANMAMREDDERFSGFAKNTPDVSTWDKESQRGMETAMKPFLGTKGLSGDAQRRLQLNIDGWRNMRNIRVASGAAQKQGQLADEAIRGNQTYALHEGNYDEVKRLQGEREKLGTAGFDDRAKLDVEIQDQQRDDMLWGAISNNPKNAPNFTRDPGFAKKYKLSGQQSAQWANRADAVWHDHERMAVGGVLDGMAQGIINKPEDLVAYENDLSPATKAELVAKITKAQPVNRPDDWNEGYSAIHQLDLSAPEDVRRAKEAQLRMWFDLKFDGSFKTEMNQLLDERIADSEGIASADMKELNELADREVERGAFGNFNVPKKDDKGRPLAEFHQDNVIPETVGSFWWKRPGTPADAIDSDEKYATAATMVDKDAKAKAESMKRDTIRAVEKWRKAQKTPPTREELFQKFNELTKGTVSAHEADSFINGGGNGLSMFEVLGIRPEKAAAALKGGLK